jgi:hypothetical protein
MEGLSAAQMGLDLPEPYGTAVRNLDMRAFEQALTPGNVFFGVIDYAALGIPSGVRGVIYDLPRAAVSGVGAISQGRVASGAEQLTGAAIVVVGLVVGVRAWRRSTRIANMLELTPEGGAVYTRVQASIGADGMNRVARYVQASSEAQFLVREQGAAGIEALHRARGNVAAARAELAAAAAAAARAAEAVTVRPRASVAQLRQMIAASRVNPRRYFTWRTPNRDIAQNQAIRFTGENTPSGPNTPQGVYLAPGIVGHNYGPFRVIIEGDRFALRPTLDATEFVLDGEIGANEGVWCTQDDYLAATGGAKPP